MKKSIITGILFLVAVSFSAQEKGHKNTRPIKDTKVIVNPIKPTVFNKEEKTTKVVVTPVNSNSTNREHHLQLTLTNQKRLKVKEKTMKKL